MRAVIQRVKEARCIVEGNTTGIIETGMVVLLGIENDDSEDDIIWLANKILNLRIFDDEQGKMNLNLSQAGGSILLISQFTLLAQTKKGNRPSFIRAAKPSIALPLYTRMVELLEQLQGRPVACGVFGAHMQIQLTNDGPVTIIMNTNDKDNF